MTIDREDLGLRLTDGWHVVETRFRPDAVITSGSNFMVGNGYLGYRGTFPEWGAQDYVGCVVTDTYDCADGVWRELSTVPNALYARWDLHGETLTLPTDAHRQPAAYERELDLRTVTTRRRWSPAHVDADLDLSDERFASLADLHVVPQRLRITADRDTTVELITGIDADVWSMNGRHLSDVVLSEDDGVLLATARTVEQGIEIAVAQSLSLEGAAKEGERTEGDGTQHLRRIALSAEARETITATVVMAVFTSNDVDDPTTAAVAAARSAIDRGWDALQADHTAAWEDVWRRTDVTIRDDVVAQTAIRYNVAHSVMATPRHTDHLPIGARGLSCQAYQGAAFWDQEVFNLPMFLYTEPDVARNILSYRHRTLDGARAKAERLGYEGAFFAWISGDTGEELCPDFFFRDVLTGRPIRNHFNDWQMHISPDIATTVRDYVRTTGDHDFLLTRGAELVFEIARFLRSFVYLKVDMDRYETIRLLGPDEYHENVDNNVFTNYQTELALRTALEVHDELSSAAPDRLTELRDDLGIDDGEIAAWRDIVDRMYLPQPDPETLVLEQFDGYLDLEDTTPDVVGARLQDPGEYWGWPNGVAVHTQVIKQADVIQLFVCQPERFDADVMAANLDYYLPRTQHGSSLSRPMYAQVAARLGRPDVAAELWLDSATVDLFATGSKTSGGTFIGGIRTAAAGVSWAVIARGFLGLVIHEDHVLLDPHLPDRWEQISLRLQFRGRWLTVTADHDGCTVSADAANDDPVDLAVKAVRVSITPGDEHRFG